MNISTCHNRRLFTFILLVVILLLTGTRSWGADKKEKVRAPAAGDLHIISDKLIVEQDKSVAEFIGNVKATQDDAVLLSDRVKVYFKPSDTSGQDKGQGNVEKIIATGHVEYTAGERKAFADQAVYTTADAKLVLTGEEPKLLTGNSWVKGRKITLFRLEERVMVESDGTKRVQAFFDSRDQAKGGSE